MANNRRPKGLVYGLFYLLFSDDIWRVAIGLVVAIWAAPHIAAAQPLGRGGLMVLALMLTAIGWWLSAWPVRKWTDFLKRQLTGSKR